MISARNVAAADRAAEQHAAHEGKALLRIEQHHASRRMPRAMQHLECKIIDADLVALIEPAVGRDVAGPGDSEAAAALGEMLEQKQVGAMRALDRNAQALLE